ncbi:sentrin-specific protease 7 isoform X1 [Nothobranchius furzeri]|uniref:SUMO specific peptidase 7 n=3 Tax=Nothobranchius furzeri TaxID=105023 RepID=A0A1A8ASZ9_NOTFU|nr:sentrin-specific protease 7 isoform X1 [Nothobranchius furzeri]XP_015821567.1 sentrin-specific protease 7 isoform X1 [Nothobranchius furzeri]XP_054602742.1 sentrin-specific protease 7 isoform X1 [Nothobranchius furzeri]KAF7215506.1 transcript variant X1 [Nothobranchius furzeri]KAF7215508.1 transcript variant X2 [Nothobranchius furzeri]
MMERRRVLTIPFTSKKDHLIKNPLKIPMACLPPECEKLEQQVPRTAFAGCKYKSKNSQHKNGSVIVDRRHADFISQEMTRRKPCLILTDVLKTKMGKDFKRRVRMSSLTRKRGRQRKNGEESNKEALISRNTRSVQKEAANNTRSKSLPLESSLKITTPSSQRKGAKKRQKKSQEDKAESLEAEEGMVDGDGGEEAEETIAEVLDCVLSSKPAGDTTSCDELSSDSVEDRPTATVKTKQQLKRKNKPLGFQFNGRSSSKRLCKSVLRLSGEDGGQLSFSGDDGVEASFSGEDGIDGGQVFASVSLEDSEEHINLENIDHCILQFTVGGDDGTEALVPVITPNVESRLDGTTQTSPSEPIVLSSDDEESNNKPQRSSEVIFPVSDTTIQESVSKWMDAPDLQDQQRAVDESPCSGPASPLPEDDYSCLSVAFCSLRCGGYKARANGSFVIAKHKIIIPLKDTSQQQNGTVSFERRELRRYSIWTQQEMEVWEFHFEDDGEPFFGILLLYVSETAAAALREDLSQLSVEDDGFINTGKASPFVLLTLKDPLEGMEGALLRSVLDLDCINSMTEILPAHGDEGHFSMEDLDTPVLSLDSSIELIRKTGLDSHLLSMLGIKDSECKPAEEQDSSDNDGNEIPTAHIWLDTDFQKESNPEKDPDPEEDTETQVEPNKDPEQEVQKSPDNPKEEAQLVYAVCHRRSKDSYSVFLQKPDSNWIKFKHRGLARRLIQFPPPPQKGGITVTMEDLRCLDSGQYLNDVIIDFYLKFLIQNASADFTERCHIFSSFFFKQLTRRDNASEGVKNDSCQRQRRHQRVKTWTRHVDIFKKDFVFVPVNQESHWYLVVICFPGLEESKLEDWTGDLDDQNESPESNAETATTQKSSDGMDSETEKNGAKSTTKAQLCQISCTKLTCQRKTVCKRPCILIMDSLKLSLHERVFKLLREYLQSEWEARRGSSRDFGPDQMKSSHCKVPLQDNSTDCGLYLLQYVECFLKDPVVHFDLPLHLQQWFPRQLIRNKRDKIRDLILNLYRHQNLENNKK